jgi:tRNA(Ile)-lysidine synthase
VFTLSRFAARLHSLLAASSAPGAETPSLCVALSGGLDSTVLLVALARLRNEGALQAQVRAVHVDHGLHPDSVLWGVACRALAQDHGVAYAGLRVEVPRAMDSSPEAAARTARYAALSRQLAPGEVLLTAHHADDQLETILLQWLRGGGLRAVAGMAPVGPFGVSGWRARPLLEFTRDELATWAGAQRLHWLEDPSNADRRFDRNYLRHEVLPALRARWPAAASTAGRVAEYARDALALEAGCVADDLAAALAGRALSLEVLGRLPEPRQRALLRAWLAGLGLPPATARTLAALRHDMIAAAADRLPETRWPGAVVRRYRDHLFATASGPQACVASEGDWLPGLEASYRWSDGSWLALSPATGVGLSRERLPDRLAVRQRRGGEAFTPSGSAHRRDLRKWLQERGVLPWRRHELPLLFVGDQLVAAADLGVAADFAARSDEPSWRIEWSGRDDVTFGDVLASNWPLHPPIR